MRPIDADLLASRLEDIAPAEWVDRYDEGASDAITQAQEMIENAPTVEVPRWISAGERLPEEGVQVIVWVYFGRHALALHDRFENGSWVLHGEGRITHWMPLPAPPEEVTPDADL